VKILLREDDVNHAKPDECGRTALPCATSDGYEGAVEIDLTLGDVNSCRVDNFS